MQADPDRFQYEDNQPNAHEREKAQTLLDKRDAVVARFMEAARQCGRELEALGVLDKYNRRLRQKQEAIETCEDMADEAESMANAYTDEAKLLGHRETAGEAT